MPYGRKLYDDDTEEPGLSPWVLLGLVVIAVLIVLLILL